MALPTGIILAWFGSIGSIPAGWVICDGNNGTPDLRDRMIVGAGLSYAVDASGGALAHSHTVQVDAHNHTLQAGTDIAAGANFNATTDNTDPTGTTNSVSNLPPYHALAWIMKT